MEQQLIELHAGDVRRSTLEGREAEPSVVTREVEDAGTLQDFSVGVDQRHETGVEPLEPRPGRTRVDEPRKRIEEAARIELLLRHSRRLPLS